MKTIFKSFACAAAAALALASCAKENLVPNDGETDGKKLVKVHFSAETTDPASSRATLTPDEGETAFAAAWDNDDQIAITYTYVDLDFSETVPGTWKDSDFSAAITDKTTGDELATMSYAASYPYSQNGEVDFGSERTQSGGGYNSKYDIMVSTKVEATAKPGLDVNGNKIVFPMERQTAIAYFHFTSDNAEEDITKATLTVEGGSIATGYALLDPSGFIPDLDSSPLSEIVLNVTGQKADDFTLWFNVLPTSYTKMTLTVETATKTFTISKNSEGTYEAGKLYKVKKNGISWTDKGGSVTPSTVEDVITASELAATDTQYADFSNKSFTSAAVYAGNSAKTAKGGIQLRSKSSNSGIVTTVSGGKAKKISIVTESGTNTIDIYGKATPYTDAANLYATLNGDQGTKLGSLTCGTDTELEIEGDYPYIGIRSNSGAIYLTSITITWETGSSEPAPDTYSISFADVTGGTLSANPASAEAGTEVTLTATPDEGYEFIENSWKVVAADDSEITVTDGKFIMPASDVTVTASFVRKPYLNAVASKTTISADGETVTVTVDTNVDGGWTAESSDETNFTIGNKTATTFDVTVSKNETEAARVATITVTAGTQTKTITLKQNATGGTVTLPDLFVTIDYKDIPDGYSASGTSGNFEKNGITINYSGINTKSASGTAYTYSMFVQNQGYIFSSTAPDGYYVKSITATFSGSTGTTGKAGISFGMSAISTRDSSVSGAVKQNGTCSATNEDKSKAYWNFSTTNKNVQVTKFDIVYSSVN